MFWGGAKSSRKSRLEAGKDAFKEIVENLKEFDKLDILTHHEREAAKHIFSQYEDPTTKLVCAVNLATMLRLLGQNPTDIDIASMIYQLSVLVKNAKTKEEMRAEYTEAFRLFDQNNDGFVHSSDIQKMMDIVGASYDEAELASLFREYDINKDGRIYYEDFIKRVVDENIFSDQRI